MVSVSPHRGMESHRVEVVFIVAWTFEQTKLSEKRPASAAASETRKKWSVG